MTRPLAGSGGPVRTDLARGSLWALLYRLGGMGAWMAVGILTARALSVEDRGAYAAAVVAVSGAGAVVASFGSSAGYFVAHRGLHPPAVASAAAVPALGLALALCAGCLAAAPVVAAESRPFLLLGAAALLPTTVREVVASVFLASGHVGRHALLLYSPPAAGLVALVAWAAVATDRHAADAFAAWTAAQWAGLLFALALARRTWGTAWLGRPRRALTAELLRFGGYTAAVGLVGFLNYRLGLLLVAFLDSREGAGIYASAHGVEEMMWVLPLSVAAASLARVGGLDRAAAGELTALAVRRSLLLVLPLAMVAMVMAPIGVEMLYGPRYAEAAVPLRILAVGAAAYAPRSLFVNYFVVQLGRPRLVLLFSVLPVAITAALAPPLIAPYGPPGAAVAQALAQVVTITAMALAFRATSRVPLRDAIVPRLEDVVAGARFARGLVRRSPVPAA